MGNFLITLGVLLIIFCFYAFASSRFKNLKATTILVIAVISVAMIATGNSLTNIETNKEENVKPKEEPVVTTPVVPTKITKTFDEEGNKEFATFLKREVNTLLEADNVVDRIDVEYLEDGQIFIIVPQSYKYMTNTEIQELSDNFFTIKNSLFQKWLVTTDYYSDSKSPILYIATPDGATLAEEDRFTNTMKRKIDN